MATCYKGDKPDAETNDRCSGTASSKRGHTQADVGTGAQHVNSQENAAADKESTCTGPKKEQKGWASAGEGAREGAVLRGRRAGLCGPSRPW